MISQSNCLKYRFVDKFFGQRTLNVSEIKSTIKMCQILCCFPECDLTFQTGGVFFCYLRKLHNAQFYCPFTCRTVLNCFRNPLCSDGTALGRRHNLL